MRGELWIKIQRVLSNKLRRKLEPGDHIYTWKRGNIKAYHGIYVSDEKVIHFDFHGVVSSSIEEFLSGGDVYLFEYGVNPALFLTKFREHTSTLASTDPPQVVQDRASFLLNSGTSSDYYRFINNDEDFAIYCKTGLLVVDSIVFSRSWQTAFFLAVTTAVFLSLLQLASATFTGLAARCLGVYYVRRLASDIGARPNVIKIEAERLPVVDEILASGGLGRIEFLIDLFLRILMGAFAFCCLLLSLWSQTLPVVWTLACIILFYWAVFGKRLLSNKIQKKQLKPGDHIYTWRRNRWYTYAHHGIYVGDGEVIHLDRGEDPISGGGQSMECHVESCNINSFLDGGGLYLYKYGVNLAFFIAKTRGGTCTLASTSPTEDVLHRARFLRKHNGFGAYNLFNNNCEDFAIYCKTGMLARNIIDIGTNGQIATPFAVIYAILLFPRGFPTSNLMVVSAMCYVTYSILRFIYDTKYCGNACKVSVERLAALWRVGNFCDSCIDSFWKERDFEVLSED
ncbi:uncharacterized protein LOC112491335 [Ziziphus jujuba]|uniref:Uncharacterized protein LOC112491335 n=1 Tax=Ziziphus jujuba TaxID=326968 RepID=A0ABM4A762_ZIZJJ|nr:uncharacterized protein LOC112491335 [Ziziphus jujuba]